MKKEKIPMDAGYTAKSIAKGVYFKKHGINIHERLDYIKDSGLDVKQVGDLRALIKNTIWLSQINKKSDEVKQNPFRKGEVMVEIGKSSAALLAGKVLKTVLRYLANEKKKEQQN